MKAGREAFKKMLAHKEAKPESKPESGYKCPNCSCKSCKGK